MYLILLFLLHYYIQTTFISRLFRLHNEKWTTNRQQDSVHRSQIAWHTHTCTRRQLSQTPIHSKTPRRSVDMLTISIPHNCYETAPTEMEEWLQNGGRLLSHHQLYHGQWNHPLLYTVKHLKVGNIFKMYLFQRKTILQV